ncbi:hypothetical protein MMC09_000701 [Bachmanniomyces sp. S44760]|nr:hypothetical protein [Bachmanniomyces sp. S44760]
MAPLTTPSRAMLRVCARQTRPPALAAPLASASQRRHKADIVERTSGEFDRTPQFQSPFKNKDQNPTTKVPSFANYMSKKGDISNRTFQYFVVGTMGLLAAAGAKNTVQGMGSVGTKKTPRTADYFLVNMSASADILAQAKVEIDLQAIPEGKNVIIKWRGKPVFIRHRTASEIKDAEDTDWHKLRDPQPDSERAQKPEWLIMLGCVPIGESGDFGGWFCPCHGSHYDISGRARKGPAPLNLEIPPYSFPEDASVIIG